MNHSELTTDDNVHKISGELKITDLFRLDELENLQKLFSEAYGVSSSITYPDGTPVTTPTNFCRLCKDVVRGTKKGREYCHLTETSFNESGSKIKPCLGGSLWEAGAVIKVGDIHLGNWLIGQTRNEHLNVEYLKNFAAEIGIEKELLIKALEEVPVMSSEKFEKVARMLFTFANELSDRAYKNLKLRNQSEIQDEIYKKLKQSEQRFHSLFDNMIEGVAFHELILDEDGEPVGSRITDINPAFERQAEMSKEQILGKSCCEVLGQDSGIMLEVYKKVVENGESVFFEAAVEPLKKYFSVAVYKSGDNGFATIFVDLTEKKAAEAELKENEARWRRAIVGAPIPIMIFDEDGKVIQISSGWTRFSGYTEDEIPTLFDWTEKAYGKRKKVRTEYVDQLFDNFKTEKNGEWIITAKDGTKRIWDFQATPLGKSSTGKRVMLSLAIDITERKRADEKLRESEQQLQFVLKGSQLGFWDWDLEADKVTRNDRWAEMLGYSAKEIEFSVDQWSDLIHPEDRENAIKSIQNHLEGKTEIHRTEYRMKHKDGHYIWVLDQAQAVKRNADGKVIRMSGTHSDITELKKTEERIKRQNEKLQKSNAEKDKFFSIIAHDLKSPFNAILGFSELFVDLVSANELDREEAIKFAKIISDSSNKVVDLLTNLMEWSRSQTGRIAVHPVQFNLKEVVDETAVLFNETLKQKSITFENNAMENLEVISDKDMISTVVRNLVSNAAKFTPSGGKIIVSAAAEPEQIKITVRDTGIGIPEAILDKLFTIGENYSTPGTENEEGTGLGLIICKEFVEKLGGRIWAESQPGKGSAFIFTIPSSPTQKILD